MAWIALLIVFSIAGIAVLVWGLAADQMFSGIVGAVVIGVVFVIISLFMSMHRVGQREVGIVYSFSGTISGKKDPGIVMTAPWQHVKTENVGIQSEEFDLDSNNSAVSKDQQPIYARLFVNFQVEPRDVVNLYKSVGPNWKNILLEARVLQDFKEITATFATTDVTNRRDQLRSETKKRLEAELSQYDVKIVDVFLKNLSFSPSYQKAIEQKQVQVQKALQAQAKIVQATAEANQRIATAKGEAEAIALKGKALEAHPSILRLEAIDKLNPNANVVICTGKSCPAFLPSGLVNGK